MISVYCIVKVESLPMVGMQGAMMFSTNRVRNIFSLSTFFIMYAAYNCMQKGSK